MLAGSNYSSPAGSPYRAGGGGVGGVNNTSHQQQLEHHSKTLSHVMQQLRERDAELLVLTQELEGLRAHNQALSRGQQQAVLSQQQVAAVQEAERQVQQLQSMVRFVLWVGWSRAVFSLGLVSWVLSWGRV